TALSWGRSGVCARTDRGSAAVRATAATVQRVQRVENITVRSGYLRNLRIVSNAISDRRGASRRVTMPCLALNRKDLPDNSERPDPGGRPSYPQTAALWPYRDRA